MFIKQTPASILIGIRHDAREIQVALLKYAEYWGALNGLVSS